MLLEAIVPRAQWVKNLPAMQETQEMQVLVTVLERYPGGGKWLPTPEFLPEKSHGQRSLGGLQLKGLPDVTEQLSAHIHTHAVVTSLCGS